MANVLARPSPAQRRAGTAQYWTGQHEPPGLPGRAAPCFVPGFWPRHGPMGRFSCHASPFSTAHFSGFASPQPSNLIIPQTTHILTQTNSVHKHITHQQNYKTPSRSTEQDSKFKYMTNETKQINRNREDNASRDNQNELMCNAASLKTFLGKSHPCEKP